MKIDFFEILIIFKNISKYMKIDFFNKKIIFYPKKNLKQTHPNFNKNGLLIKQAFLHEKEARRQKHR